MQGKPTLMHVHADRHTKSTAWIQKRITNLRLSRLGLDVGVARGVSCHSGVEPAVSFSPVLSGLSCLRRDKKHLSLFCNSAIPKPVIRGEFFPVEREMFSCDLSMAI